MSELVGIYGIKNTLNGKWYIGQSIDVSSRQRGHFNSLKIQKHHNFYLQRAYNKYGEEAFEFHVLEECPENMLDIRECHWIAYYKSTNNDFGYNLESGGKLNKRHSKESKQKMSLVQKGRKVSDETKQKISASLTGKPLSEERRKNMGLARKGKPLSEAHKRKLSLIFKGRKLSPETLAKMRGRKRSEESRRKMSESGKRNWTNNSNFREAIRLAHLGKKLSEETKKKMSEAHRGHSTSDTTRMKISLANKGKKRSEETRKKISLFQVGKVMSEETKRKIGEASRNKWKDPTYRNKMSLVLKGNQNAVKTKLLDLNKEKELSNV